ncbi:MAG: dCTP deaminase [Nitrospinota bacterium]
MSIKSDRWIKEMANKKKIIDPFEENQVRKGIISFGLSSYGYDIRIGDEFKIPDTTDSSLIDPKNFDASSFNSIKADHCIIPAHSYVLGKSVEYFRLPRNILTLCFGKSTYARCGVIVNITPLEPEWEGYITMAICNTSGRPVKLYSREGIAQIIFLESDDICLTSYADKKGKYQAQKKLTVSKID